MELDNVTAVFLFVVSVAIGGLLGSQWGGSLVGRRLHDLQDTVNQMKRRWWSAWRRMMRLAEQKEAEDRGDYWKDGGQPPWYA